MVVIESILAFIVLVGILVFVHEMGHFLAARWCGVRADVFAVGMGPRLFGWNRKNGFTFGKFPEDLDLQGGTDYRLSAFPIGGYVKIAGMVDESMDTEFVATEPQPWEFRSKNTLQKAFIISAGVIMNFLLAIVVFAVLNFSQGKTLAATTTVGPLPKDGPALAAGLREGDRITAINGEEVKHFEEINRGIYINHPSDDITLAVDRGGMPMTIKITRASIPDPSSGQQVIPFSAFNHPTIVSVLEGSPAEKAGLKSDDVITSADGKPMTSRDQLIEHISNNDGHPITLGIQRKAANPTTTSITVTPGSDGKIGTELTDGYHGPRNNIDYSFSEALASGWDETVTVTGGTFGLVGRLVTGNANLKESVGGPGKIAVIAQQTASRGLTEFLKLMGILSVTLACMNILPIPALDGGHLVFILVEGIFRREVPLKIRMAVQQVGFALLIIFMAFVLYNDATWMVGK